MEQFNLDRILEKACSQEPLTKSELVFLLGLTEECDLTKLFEAARSLRHRYFTNKVFLYGFVYFSTWCRNDCNFCYYRKSNLHSKRYRKSEREILAAACRLAESGVHLIDLTMGEDPFYHSDREGLERLADLVREVKSQTALPVMVSPGVVSKQGLKILRAAGADWYACYQETHNRRRFNELRVNQSYDRRWLSKKAALETGLLVEEGILVGVGETLTDIAHSLQNMGRLGAQQVRVMSFVSYQGITVDSFLPISEARLRELKVIAVLRLVFPDRLIPASLDVDGIQGLQARINAGANVVTSLIPPRLGLAGVAQTAKDIDEGYRTVQGVLPFLEEMGLTAATTDDYLGWVQAEYYRLK